MTRCQHDNCRAEAIECTPYGSTLLEYTPEWFCSFHAPQHDYCRECGMHLQNNAFAGDDWCNDCMEKRLAAIKEEE